MDVEDERMKPRFLAWAIDRWWYLSSKWGALEKQVRRKVTRLIRVAWEASRREYPERSWI